MYNKRSSPTLGAYVYAFFGTGIALAAIYWYSMRAMQGVIERVTPSIAQHHGK